MDWLSSIPGFSGIRALAGLVLIFLVPGFAWTLVLFTKVNAIERFVLSAGLSMALVTLGVLAANVLFGVRVNGLNSLVIIVVLAIIPLALYGLKRFMRQRAPKQD